MRKNNVKGGRLNAEVYRELSNILHGGLKDPRIHPMTSLVKVDVASDLKTAKAYISVLGSEEDAKKTMEGLRSSAGRQSGRRSRSD